MKIVRQARVWKRILAFLLDLIICLYIFGALLILLENEVPGTAALFEAGLSPVALVAFLYLGLFVLLYHTFTEWMLDQTVGMMIFGIRVQSKKPLLFWQAFVRNLFIIPVLPFNLLWVVEPMYYVFQGERLLERWTHTQTVE